MLPAAFDRAPSDIVAEVFMTRAAVVTAIVLVEGPSDSRFLKRHVTNETQIIICGGKRTLLLAMDQINQRENNDCIAIIDQDFDDHKGIQRSSPLFVTDTHDLETMLLSFRLTSILTEFGEASKIAAFEAVNGVDLTTGLLQRAEEFSKIHYLNGVSPGFGSDLSKFSPWKYVKVETWMIDKSALASDFANGCTQDSAVITNLLTSLLPLCSWSDVRGHDVLALLSIGLRKVLASGKQVGELQLASALRLAFSENDFEQTRLYSLLKQWQEGANLPLLCH